MLLLRTPSGTRKGTLMGHKKQKKALRKLEIRVALLQRTTAKLIADVAQMNDRLNNHIALPVPATGLTKNGIALESDSEAYDPNPFSAEGAALADALDDSKV